MGRIKYRANRGDFSLKNLWSSQTRAVVMLLRSPAQKKQLRNLDKCEVLISISIFFCLWTFPLHLIIIL